MNKNIFFFTFHATQFDINPILKLSEKRFITFFFTTTIVKCSREKSKIN